MVGDTGREEQKRAERHRAPSNYMPRESLAMGSDKHAQLGESRRLKEFRCARGREVRRESAPNVRSGPQGDGDVVDLPLYMPAGREGRERERVGEGESFSRGESTILHHWRPFWTTQVAVRA